MVFLDWKALPWYWCDSDQLLVVRAAGGAGAGAARVRVRLLRVPLAHQGRVLLDHHAGADLRRHAALLPQRHRLRRQQRLHRLQAHPRLPDHHAGDAHGAVRDHRRGADRHAAARAAAIVHVASSAACSPRSATPRRASCSAATTRCYYKLFIWTLSAVLCGIAGALYVPQVGIINPSEMSPANSIEIAIWVAVGGRGTLIGADRSAPGSSTARRASSRRRFPSTGCSCSACCSSW